MFSSFKVQHYILVVQASDAGIPSLSSTVTVYCNVLDLNDNAPIFESGPRIIDIPENMTIGSIVTSLTARDLDSSSNGQLVYTIVGGDEHEDFGIDDNGTLYTRRILDRETRANYNLLVQAADRPKAIDKILATTVQVSFYFFCFVFFLRILIDFFIIYIGKI